MAAERCFYCKRVLLPKGSPLVCGRIATKDHFKPKALRRRHDEEKYVTSCLDCNTMKGHTPPEVFQAFVNAFGTDIHDNKRSYLAFCYDLMLAGLSKEWPLERAAEQFPHSSKRARRKLMIGK